MVNEDLCSPHFFLLFCFALMFLHFNMACNKSIIGTCESMWCSVVHQSLCFNLFSLPIQTFPSSLLMAMGRALISSPDSNTLSIADLLVGTSSTTTKLWGKNYYLQQSAAVKTFLSSNEKLKYIEEEPADAISSKWIKEDAQVRLWPWNFCGASYQFKYYAAEVR